MKNKDVKLARLLRYGTLMRENFEYDAHLTFPTPRNRWLGPVFVVVVILGILAALL